MYNNLVRGQVTGLREAWKRTLREHGARLLFLVSELNGDTREQRQEHWHRLRPGLKGIEWKLPNWPNVFPESFRVFKASEKDWPLKERVPAMRKYFADFMDSWFRAGRDFRRWSQANPELASALGRASQAAYFNYQSRMDDGQPEPRPVQDLTGVRDVPLYQAAFVFGYYFLQNSLRDVLAGRCKRCQRYFFNRKGYAQMVYCRQQCRWSAHNARKQQARFHAQETMERTALAALRILLSALGKQRGPVHNFWKQWVVGRVNKKHKTRFEPKWLTRTINDPDGKHHSEFVRVQNAIERLLSTAKRSE